MVPLGKRFQQILDVRAHSEKINGEQFRNEGDSLEIKQFRNKGDSLEIKQK